MSCSLRASFIRSPAIGRLSARFLNCDPVCRLGTTKKNAGSEENFTRIDKEYVCQWSMHLDSPHPRNMLTSFPFSILFSYVVNAAKAAKVDKDQRLIYVSVRPLPYLHCVVDSDSSYSSHPPSVRRPWPIPTHQFFTRVVRA